jgi:hypothetical protein
MQTNNRNQNNNMQIPSLGRAEKNQNKPIFLPIHTCQEQSPVCFIKDHPGPCNHKFCMMSFKKPQFFGISVNEFYSRREFLEFDVILGNFCLLYIVPHNSDPDAGDGFEGFRQSMNAISHLAGQWPNVRTVLREHVEFKWAEFIDSYPFTNYSDFTVEWRKRIDVQEYAFYVGPINVDDVKHIEVNPVYKYPERYNEIVKAVNEGGSNA